MTKIVPGPSLRATEQPKASPAASPGREREPSRDAVPAAQDSFERAEASPFAPSAQQLRTGGAPLGLNPYTGHRRIPAGGPVRDEPGQAPAGGAEVWSLRGGIGNFGVPVEPVRFGSFWTKQAAVLGRDPLTLRDDKSFVLSVVRQQGMELACASERLRADPEVVMAAVQSQGGAIRHASPELKQVKELALAAVRDDVSAWDSLWVPARHDPDVLAEASRLSGPVNGLQFQVHFEMPPGLAKDRDYQLRLVRQNAWAINYVPKELLSDATFAAEAAMAFPPLLDRPPLQARKDELFAARAGLRERYQTVAEGAHVLGIEDPMRLRSAELLDEVLRNRLQPASGDSRPVAAVVYCKSESDHNGAMRQHNFDELGRHYRIRYYEARGEAELAAAIKDAGQAVPASLVVIGGHGTQGSIQLGAGKGDDAAALGLEDEPALHRMGLEGVVSQDAAVVLMSCSTGQGGSERNNVANMMARLLPGRVVFAPTRPTMDQLKFDRRGRFVDPSYRGGAEETFRAWRLQLGPSE